MRGGSLYTTTSATYVVALMDKNSEATLCLAPSPDAAFDEQVGEGFSLSLVDASRDDSQGFSESEAEASLGGRSPNVLITREIFYRLCELFVNTSLTDEQKVALYQTTLNSVIQGNAINLGSSTAAEASASADMKASQLPDHSESADD